MSINSREPKFKWDVLIILGFILISTIPFINKPFHIDDHNFIVAGENILHHPFQPFNGNPSLLDREFPAPEKIPNDLEPYGYSSSPRLLSYIIALVISTTGNITERSLHIFYILYSALAAVSAYFLGKRFTRHPLIITLFMISSPIFVLSSHSIMADMAMLAFFLSGMCTFIYGIDNDNKKILLISGVFIGLAVLTKSSGLILIPILFTYWILNKRRLYNLLFPFLIYALAFGVWVFLNLIYYGELNLFGTLKFFAKPYENYDLRFNYLIQKGISDLSAIGGCAIFPIAWIVVVFINARKIIIYSASVLFSLYFLIINPLDIKNPLNFESLSNYSSLQSILFIYFLSTGLFITYSVFDAGIKPFLTSLSNSSSLKIKTLIYQNTDNIYLFFWFGVILISSIIFLPFGCARYMLPLLLPIIVIFINQTEKVFGKKVKCFQIICISVIITNLLTGLSLAYGDYVYAESYKSFVKSLRGKFDNNRVWFIGDWGFQYYMLKAGYSYLPQNDNYPKDGDIIVKPQIAGYQNMATELRIRAELIESIGYDSKFPIRLMNYEANAGYYAHGFGFLPFSFSTAELERFDIFKVSTNLFIKNLNKADIQTPSKEWVTPLIFDINGDSRATIFEHPPSRITYKLTIPENSSLSFGIALRTEVWSSDKGDGVVFEILAKDGSEERKLFSKYIDPKNNIEDRKWHEELIDLSEFGGKEILLIFITSPGPSNNTDYDWAGWSKPQFVSNSK